MKIRMGFVSNSSSSSFIIYGNKVETEDDLQALLGTNKKYINTEAKKYYKGCRNCCENTFDYLFDKFKNVDETLKITDDEQYYNLEERKVYEVDPDIFYNKLNDKDSWICKVIKENVEMSLSNMKIKHRDTWTLEENVYCYDYLQASDCNKNLYEDMIKVFTKEGIEEVKSSFNHVRNLLGNGMKVYFISFCTDDGKPEPFDSFFRSGIPFRNANKIRDERS